MQRALPQPRPRGRPRRPPQVRYAVEVAMLALDWRVTGKPDRARKGAGNPNVREAARRVARLFAALGYGRGFSAGSILRVWYDRTPYARPADESDQVLDAIPLSTREAARILAAAGRTVRPGAVLDFERERARAGAAAILHPFELALAFAEDRKNRRI